ncbi:MAG: EI24 domain-containing protein [Cyanobacteriota bacterium]|nr:EI24 domain-containing protein [Cyanobacteriota bacterium]
MLSAYQPQRGSLYQFWMGIRFWGEGWRLLRASPRLQITSILPVLLTMGVLLGLSWVSSQLTGVLLGYLPATLPSWVMHGIGALSGVVVLLGLVLFLFFPLMSLISIPFREALAKQTEGLLRGQVSEGVGIPWGAALADTVRQIGMQVFLLLLAAGMGWGIPVLGQLTMILILIFLAGLDMVDPPLSGRGLRFHQKLAFVQKHRCLMAGFSLITFGWLAVPLLNLLVLPIATIGATVLVIAVQPPTGDAGQPWAMDPSKVDQPVGDGIAN